IWLMTPEGIVGTYRARWDANWNAKVLLAALTEQVQCGDLGIVGKTRGDGFGCFLLKRQNAANVTNVHQAALAIRKLAECPGFVVDLRSANGGSEPLAQQIAGCFCARDVVYAKSKYRTGEPDHLAFGRAFDRVLKPASDPFVKPVMVLIGPGCVSSGENFV